MKKVKQWGVKSVFLVNLLSLTVLLSMSACANRQAGQPSESRIVAEVMSYAEQAYHRDFADGQGSSYDVSVVVVQQPADQRGRRISIIHTSTPGSNSAWRLPKSKLSFSLSPAVKDKDEVFVSAVRDLRVEK